MGSQKHPQSTERTARRGRLRDRRKPDYCYSDEQNEKADVPDYHGPFAENLPNFFIGVVPQDDGQLQPLSAIEELIELQQRLSRCD